MLLGRRAGVMRRVRGVNRMFAAMMRMRVGSSLVVRHAGGAPLVPGNGRARHPDARGDRMQRQHQHQ